MVTRIRRYVETDTGHRVPNHKVSVGICMDTATGSKPEIEGDSRNWCFRRRHVDGFFRC